MIITNLPPLAADASHAMIIAYGVYTLCALVFCVVVVVAFIYEVFFD